MAFISIDCDTKFLFPPSVQDWLSEDHLARFVVNIVGQLDLHVLYASYKENGEAACPPSMLLSLLFYGYATGTFSSRMVYLAANRRQAADYLTKRVGPGKLRKKQRH